MIFEIRNESLGVNWEPKVYVSSMMSAGEGAAGMSEMLFRAGKARCVGAFSPDGP